MQRALGDGTAGRPGTALVRSAVPWFAQQCSFGRREPGQVAGHLPQRQIPYFQGGALPMSLGFAGLRDTAGRKMSHHYEVRKNTFWILNNPADLKGRGAHKNLSIMVTMSPAPSSSCFLSLPIKFWDC